MPADNGGNTLAAVANGYQNPQAVFNAIQNDTGALNKAQARANFLQAIHKEIAIAKIAAYLAAAPTVNANALPNRTVADVDADAIPRANDNDYKTYDTFIRGAGYNAAQLNAFVAELAARKQEAVFMSQINT